MDFAILRELVVGNQPRARPDRVTLRAMAERLGVHANTVAMRMRRLEERDLFLPLTLEVTPAIGMQYASYFFPMQRGLTPALRAQLCTIDGVHVIPEYAEGVLLLFFGTDRPAIQGALAKATAILAPSTPEPEISSWEDWPDLPQVPLKRHDADILSRLAADPRTPLGRIAADLGLTTRSVELRLEALRKAGAIAMMIGGSATPEGMVMGHFLAKVQPGRRRDATIQQLTALCPNYFYRNIMAMRFTVAVYAGSTAALLEQAEKFRAVPGTSQCKTRIMTRWTVNPNFGEYLAAALVRPRGG